MKTLRQALTLMLLLFAALASGTAFARGGGHGGHGGYHGGGGHWHGSVGFYFGGPYWGGYWPGYYPYYPAYPAYYPAYYPPYYGAGYAGSAEYVEQGNGGQTAPSPQSQAWWYYCADSKSYYPYVKECPAGWQRVAPQPPQQ